MMTLFLLMGNPDDPGGMMSLVFMGAIFLVFYLFIIRPQTKRQKEIQQKITDMKKGDKVVTSGGIIAPVTQIDDDSILAEVSSGVKIRILKSAITDVNPQKPAAK